MKISTFAKICTSLSDLENVSKCDVFMTKKDIGRIIISFCFNRDICGSIVIKEQGDVESYEVVIDSKQLAVLYVKSPESDFDIPNTIVKLIKDCDFK
jgi:hypothetical protein